MTALTFVSEYEYASVMQPVTTDNVIDRIRAWMTANRYSVNGFATIAGVSEGTLRGIHEADWQPSVRTLRKLEAVIPAGWRPGDELPETPPHPGPLPAGAREKDGEAA